MTDFGADMDERVRLARPLAGDFADAEVGGDSDDEENREQRIARASLSRRKALIGAALCVGLLVASAYWYGRLAPAGGPALGGASAFIREQALVVGHGYRRLPDSFCRNMQKIRPVFRGVNRRECQAKCSATVDCGAYMMIENRDDCVLLAGCDSPSHSSVGTYVMLKADVGAVDVDVGDDVGADMDVAADVGDVGDARVDVGEDVGTDVGDEVDDGGVIVVHHHHHHVIGVDVGDDLPLADDDGAGARVVVIHDDELPPPTQSEFDGPPELIVHHHHHPYDCQAGVETWMRSWSDDKKNWCCTQYYDGCPDFNVQHQHPYNCRADIATWPTSWSPGKKEYCCHQYYNGCPDEHSWGHQGNYDCRAEVATWETSWGPGKKKYCCESYYNGCPTGPRYDCQVHVLTWKSRWTHDKKHWCCSYHHIGCEDKEVDVWFPQYQCKLGDPHKWDERQKAWCCALDNIGCQVDLIGVSFDCGAAYNNFQAAWSEIKKAWCCVNHRIGCPGRPSTTTPFTSGPPTTTTPWAPLFDCQADWAHWMSSWSPEKKAWCCRHSGKGCVAPTTTTPFLPGVRTTTTAFPVVPTMPQTTSTPFITMPKTTTTPFVTMFKTTTTPFPVPFDCEAGWANWDAGWSFEKKEWCCQHFGKGCLGQTTTTPFPMHPTEFDCEADFFHWMVFWSEERKAWCCVNKGRGCKETTTTPFPMPPAQPALGETTTTPFPMPPPRPPPQETTTTPFPMPPTRPPPQETTTTPFPMPPPRPPPQETTTTPFPMPPTRPPPQETTTTPFPMPPTRPPPQETTMTPFPTPTRPPPPPPGPQGPPGGFPHPQFPSFPSPPAFHPWNPFAPGQGQTTTTKYGRVEYEGTFDCTADWALWMDAWSALMKDWCCKNQGKGCQGETSTTSYGQVVYEDFDCNAGWANWQAGWSSQKQDWCCAKQGKGCRADKGIVPQGPTTTPYGQGKPKETFDCEAGWALWQAGWSELKKDWCCARYGKGCRAQGGLQHNNVVVISHVTVKNYPGNQGQDQGPWMTLESVNCREALTYIESEDCDPQMLLASVKRTCPVEKEELELACHAWFGNIIGMSQENRKKEVDRCVAAVRTAAQVGNRMPQVFSTSREEQDLCFKCQVKCKTRRRPEALRPTPTPASHFPPDGSRNHCRPRSGNGQPNGVHRRIRVDASEMSGAQWKRLSDALSMLKHNGKLEAYARIFSKALPPEDPIFLNFQQLPWYRRFIFDFETDLQVVAQDCDLTLPYWNACEAAGPGTMFASDLWSPDKLGGRPVCMDKSGDCASPHVASATRCAVDRDRWCLGDGIASGWTVGASSKDECRCVNRAPGRPKARPPQCAGALPAMRLAEDFKSLTEAVDALRAVLHCGDGPGQKGTMCHQDAAVWDPLFWLDYAFMDKIFFGWQRHHFMVNDIDTTNCYGCEMQMTHYGVPLSDWFGQHDAQNKCIMVPKSDPVACVAYGSSMVV